MADDIVDHLIQEFADAGANYITFHPEGVKHVDRSLSLVKANGLKCGLVINPGTPLSVIKYTPIANNEDSWIQTHSRR